MLALTITTFTANATFGDLTFTRADKNGDGIVSAGELVRS